MKRKLLALFLAGVMSASIPFAVGADNTQTNLLSFPGAEGGGRFTSGGRGCEVYVVTTLEDYTSDEEPIKGSLRDAVSQDNRYIVFNVSGNIILKERLAITNKKNITIAGQTAPGDGITINGYETNISNSENMIIRYLRFRPGAENVHKGDSMDAIWGRSMKDIMIDHLSTSWSTDETMSLYRAENMTVQWSIIAESLTMSGHTKGRHGYGAIWGGVNTTYHHNLVANHTSRSPRMGGGTPEADDNENIALFDMRNNVIYNWGFNSNYGGGRSQANFINNYMKPGNGTRDNVSSRLIDAGEKDKPGEFYVAGNVMTGSSEITADNSKGIYVSEAAAPTTKIVDTEFKMDANSSEALRTTSAEEAYKEVLAKAGATYPRRDALDARIINEVENNEGRFVNRHEEVGGLPVSETISRPADFDKDMDGIADEWELANGLDPTNPNDSKELSADGSGYTNIEVYCNSLVDMDFAPENPEISMVSPANNKEFTTGEPITITANVTDNDGIAKVDFYNSDVVIGTATEAPYTMTTTLPDGTYYISAKATDKAGSQTQATASVIHVSNANNLKLWKSTDIGSPAIKGNASLSTDGQFTVKGSGKLRDNSDNFRFTYREITGDCEIIAKVDSMTPVDNHAFAGLMIRDSLSADAKTSAVGLSWTKAYSWKETNPETGKSTTYYRNPWSAYMVSRYETGKSIDLIDENIDSPEAAEESGVALINDIPFKTLDTFNGYYLKLNRKGNVFTSYGSADGVNWTEIGSRTIEMDDTVYIGMAVDGNKVANDLDNLNTAKFSNVLINK